MRVTNACAANIYESADSDFTWKFALDFVVGPGEHVACTEY
jgi:hypothetical protein